MGKKANIETGHEIPTRSTVTSFGDVIVLNDTIRSLQPGQSFVVDHARGRARALQAGNRLCIPLTSIQIESGDDEVKRFRIWRTK